MKQQLVIILFGFLLVLSTQQVFAETSVDIENKGEGATSDVHVENSVDNGSSSTTVCINGKCETTQGNVDRQEGGASVKVENSVNQNINTQSPKVTPTQSQNPASESAESSISAKATELKQQGEQQQSAFAAWMNNLSKMITDFFSQNK